MSAPSTWIRPLLAGCAAVGVFTLDLELGHAYATPVAYVVVPWILAEPASERRASTAAGLCALLVLMGLYLNPLEAGWASALFSRVLALALLSGTARLCALRARERCVREKVEREAREQTEVLRASESSRRRSLHEQQRRARALLSILEDLEFEREKLRRALAEHRRTEVTLDRSEERTSSILRNAMDAIVTVDLEGRITDWNPEAEKVFGWPREEALGACLVETIVPESWRECFLAAFERRKTGAGGALLSRRLELEGRRRTGELFPIEVAVIPIEVRDGHEYSAFIRDVSERRIWERSLQEANEALQQAVDGLLASNEQLERFAYVASHDLQTPLRAIAGFAQILTSDCAGSLDPEAAHYLERIVQGVGRMQNLIGDLLSYARVQSQDRPLQPADLEQALEEALVLLEAALQTSGASVTHEALPAVLGDRAQLVQLLQNLIENAVKYRGAQSPRVHLSAHQVQGEWVIVVRDNGLGIDPRHHERIFEVFERLHSQREFPGTGIGLAMCRRIVSHHGGRIWVDSQLGKGSSFFFTLPVLVAEQAVSA